MLAAAAEPAAADEGLRLPARAGAGIDPSLAGGWFDPSRERFGASQFHWRDTIGFAPSRSMQWSYDLGARSSVGMSIASGRDYYSEPVYGAETRQYGLIGRYLLAPHWSFSAEAVSRAPGTVLRLQDIRFGLQRQF